MHSHNHEMIASREEASIPPGHHYVGMKFSFETIEKVMRRNLYYFVDEEEDRDFGRARRFFDFQNEVSLKLCSRLVSSAADCK